MLKEVIFLEQVDVRKLLGKNNLLNQHCRRRLYRGIKHEVLKRLYETIFKWLIVISIDKQQC
jgi:hypothetical protein